MIFEEDPGSFAMLSVYDLPLSSLYVPRLFHV
jgi:hypothetical protein